MKERKGKGIDGIGNNFKTSSAWHKPIGMLKIVQILSLE
jgi:hypothetical protein